MDVPLYINWFYAFQLQKLCGTYFPDIMQSVDMEEIPINDVITKQPVKENGTKEDDHIYESQEQAAPLLQSPNSEQQVSRQKQLS